MKFNQIKDKVRHIGRSEVLGNGRAFWQYLLTRGSDPASCSEAIETFMSAVWPDMKVEITQDDNIRFTALRDGVLFSHEAGISGDPYTLKRGDYMEYCLFTRGRPTSTCLTWLAVWYEEAAKDEPLPARLLAALIPGAAHYRFEK